MNEAAVALAAALSGPDPVVATTAYDMMSARLAARAGFDAVFCSGYGLAASHLGRPDAGFLDLRTVAGRAEAMVSSVSVPVLVDADDGFDAPAETFARLEVAGAAAVMLEDQVPEKRCGHVAGKSVVTSEEMCHRIANVVAARSTATLLIARTDAREPLGLDEALCRGQAYAAAGADVVFIEAPESQYELGRIATELPCPAMANVLPGGKTPATSVDQLAKMGFRLVVFGLVDLMVATGALRAAFAAIRESGHVGAYGGPALSFSELNDLTGLTDHVAES